MVTTRYSSTTTTPSTDPAQDKLCTPTLTCTGGGPTPSTDQQRMRSVDRTAQVSFTRGSQDMKWEPRPPQPCQCLAVSSQLLLMVGGTQEGEAQLQNERFTKGRQAWCAEAGCLIKLGVRLRPCSNTRPAWTLGHGTGMV